MSKKFSVALLAGVAVALGYASSAFADGYEYLPPPAPELERKVEHHDYYYPPRPAYTYYEQTTYRQESLELNGRLDLDGFVGGVGDTSHASGGGGGGVVLAGGGGFGFGGAGAFAGAAAAARASASASASASANVSISFGGGGGHKGGGGHGGGHGGGGGGHGGGY